MSKPDLRDKCTRCSVEYTVGGKKDVGHIYMLAARFNNIEVRCPNCGLTTRLFIHSELLLQLINTGVKFDIELTPPTKVAAEHREANRRERYWRNRMAPFEADMRKQAA